MPEKGYIPDMEQARFSEAIRLEEEGDLEAAYELLLDLSNEVPDSASLFTRKGHVEWRRGWVSEALDSFRRAVAISPSFRVASLSLFHCLWEQGLEKEAFQEALRFSRVTGDDEYHEILDAFGLQVQ